MAGLLLFLILLTLLLGAGTVLWLLGIIAVVCACWLAVLFLVGCCRRLPRP